MSEPVARGSWWDHQTAVQLSIKEWMAAGFAVVPPRSRNDPGYDFQAVSSGSDSFYIEIKTGKNDLKPSQRRFLKKLGSHAIIERWQRRGGQELRLFRRWIYLGEPVPDLNALRPLVLPGVA